MISALYVQKDGVYYGVNNIDPWDEERDARSYNGPHPVIAHPPCQRWGKMWAGNPAVIAKTGVRKKKGDDDGCFKAALSSVRKWGGVLEHPWGSHAWAHFGLQKPSRHGAWIIADDFGGFTCCVEQGRYGHYCPKPTLLYAAGISFQDLPSLNWGITEVKDSDFPEWALERYGIKKCRKAGLMAFKGGGENSSARIHTPKPFMDILLLIAKKTKKKA